MHRIISLSSAFRLLAKILVGILITVHVGFASADENLSEKRKKELINIVKTDCGACHGTWLRGNLGPPLLPSHLRDKPKSYLVKIIQEGVPGTPMAPLKDILSKSEIEFIAQYLLMPRTLADEKAGAPKELKDS